MSILINKQTRVLVQGITGNEGLFHAQQMMNYNTQVVAGVTPGKGGEWVMDGKVPILNRSGRHRSNRCECHGNIRSRKVRS